MLPWMRQPVASSFTLDMKVPRTITLDVRVLGGVAMIGAALWMSLRRFQKRPEHEERPVDFGQLVNRSALQKRHAFHADVVDDDTASDELNGDDELRGGRHHRDWQEKEDSLIRLLFDLMRDHNCTLRDACEMAEHYIYEYLAGVSSELRQVAPELASPSDKATAVRRLHSTLPLSEAFRKYNGMTRISSRKKVPPQFREVRNIVNLAQVLASATAGLRLITFDGDGTLYPDRSFLDDADQKEDTVADPTGTTALITLLMDLLEMGVAVALVTAVGDPSPVPYERRLSGLLRRLNEREGMAKKAQLFAVGGQCNYVFRYDLRKGGFVALAREKWEPASMRNWTQARINAILDAAQASLVVTANQLGMTEDVKLLRKERAVGLLYTGKFHQTTPYFLDELALKARDAVKHLHREKGARLPFCTFNGGRDVFVDVGSKEMGINLLRDLVGAERSQTLHVGDQFTRTGNDLLARKACGTVWVDNPQESAIVLRELLGAMNARKDMWLNF